MQLRRLSDFITARKRNWEYLRLGLSSLDHCLEFALPTHAVSWNPDDGFCWDSSGCRTDCSWFGFKLAVKPEASFSRTDLVKELDRNLIGNRMLFGGNLVRQPAFVDLLANRPTAYRTVGQLHNSDQIMEHTFFLGTYPGLTRLMLNSEIDVIKAFVSKYD